MSYSLDAKQNEATAEPCVFTVGDKEFIALSPEEVDLESAKKLQSLANSPDDNELEMIEFYVSMLFEPEDYEELIESLPRKKLTQGVAGTILEKWHDHYGIDLGEAETSTRSSKNKKRR